eukprot:scaffold9477_cov197-Amphora_coffeaeformis.AAC.6
MRIILAQDRHVLNFEHYQPSAAHHERLAALAQVAPELYDNPDITPRAKWFAHPLYRRNSQMPPFHVHFREEMQQVVACLWQALSASQQQQQQRNGNDHLRRAFQIFQGSMRGLHGHVSIEEYACFPVYQQTFPQVNLAFLVDDHKELHRAEQHVAQTLRKYAGPTTSTTTSSGTDDDDDDLLYAALEVVLDFDEQLMAHLGEEEEIVVPLSLTEKHICNVHTVYSTLTSTSASLARITTFLTIVICEIGAQASTFTRHDTQCRKPPSPTAVRRDGVPNPQESPGPLPPPHTPSPIDNQRTRVLEAQKFLEERRKVEVEANLAELNNSLHLGMLPDGESSACSGVGFLKMLPDHTIL